MGARMDLQGERFGRLLVTDYVPPSKWRVECDCGKSKIVYACNLRSGVTQSCGCLQRETTAKARKTHGHSKHPIYKTWGKMKERCLDSRSRDFPLYGGRGVSVHPAWLVFENFWNDVAGTWAVGLSLDRYPDKNGNYEPGNVRWATQVQQVENRRNSKLILTPWGEMTVGRAAKRMGMSYTPFAYRVKNWPPEKWFDLPDAIKVKAGRPKRRSRK